MAPSSDMKDVLDALRNITTHSNALDKPLQALSTLSTSAATASRHGVSLLHAKYATLLRYNLNLARLALLRLHGKSTEVPLLAEKLIEDAVAIAKLRPIEGKLQHHIDILLGNTGADSAEQAHGGEAILRPNPSAVVLNESEGADGMRARPAANGADGTEESADIYRPPRLAEVVYDGRGAASAAERQQRSESRRRHRALALDGVRDMVAELRGLPDVVTVNGITPTSATGDAASTAGGGGESQEARRFRREEGMRRRYEEENLTRLVVSKKDKKRRREMEVRGLGGGDEVDGLRGVAERVLERGRMRKKSRVRSSGASGKDDRRVMQDKLDEALDKE